jgi:hypothetical protein
MPPIESIKQSNEVLKWKCFKVSFLFPVLFYLFYGFTRVNDQLLPVGLCQLLDCTFLSNPLTLMTIGSLLFLASWFYLNEKGIIPALAILSSVCLICLSYEQSSGITTETGIISLFFIVQFLAYCFKSLREEFNLNLYRLEFPKQIVAAVYTLSGLSKLVASGTDWFTKDSYKFSLEILRVHYVKYSATGNDYFISKGLVIAEFLMAHPELVCFCLFLSLLLELFSGLILFGESIALIYGVLLLLFHLVIYICLDISYPTIMWPMVVACINPLFWMVKWVWGIEKGGIY